MTLSDVIDLTLSWMKKDRSIPRVTILDILNIAIAQGSDNPEVILTLRKK